MVTITIGGRRDTASRAMIRPSGWLGRLSVRSMNRRHAKLTDWALQFVTVARNAAVLDIGCGGGRTVAKLAAMTADGKVTGIDHAEASIEVSRKTNANARNVEIVRGSVSDLPFPEASFDVVTAIETHYYWPDLPADVREVLRVLKPDGTFAIVAEAYKGGRNPKMLEKFEQLANIKLLTPVEHRDLLAAAGFSDVAVHEEPGKGWLCVTGRKPR